MKVIYLTLLIAIIGATQTLSKTITYYKSTSFFDDNGKIDKDSFEVKTNDEETPEKEKDKIKSLIMKKNNKEESFGNIDDMIRLKTLSGFRSPFFDDNFGSYGSFDTSKFMNFFREPEKHSFSMLNMNDKEKSNKKKMSRSCNSVTGLEVGLINPKNTEILQTSDCHCRSKHCGISYRKPDADKCLISKVQRRFESNCQAMKYCQRDKFCDGIYQDNGKYFKVNCGGEISHQPGTNGEYVIQVDRC